MDNSRIKLFHIEPNFLGNDADHLFRYCLNLETWEQNEILMFGKFLNVPRLVTVYSNNNTKYCYSKIIHKKNSLTKTFCNLLEKVSTHLDIKFNHLLLNFYRNGNDSVGWHRDNEKSLGKIVNIAMVSLGATRIFSIKHRQTKKRISINLNSGSLVLMKHPFQLEYLHCLPKMPKISEGRISITFRNIVERETK